MLAVSYAAAAAAMLVAVLYLFLRLRPFISTTTILLGSLLIIYGPACLSYTLSSGEHSFLINRLTGVLLGPGEVFSRISAKVPDLDAVIVAMNLSLALMYLCIIAGIEIVGKFAPRAVAVAEIAKSNWTGQSLQDDVGNDRILLVTISALALFMLAISVAEHHLSTISNFFSIKGDNGARDLFRLRFGGSPIYLYRLIVTAVAPMFVIMGILAGILRRSWAILLVTFLLFAATLIGKIETLSKAPPALFLLQLMLAALLARTNRISWRFALSGSVIAFLVIYTVASLIMIFPEQNSSIRAVYSRVFEAENESLLENFATFPFMHPFMWGAGIRPIAALIGTPLIHSDSLVAYTWIGSHDVTNPSLFIADAWANFSYLGVILSSVALGMICRSIDLTFLARGKSVVGIAVLGATFLGVFALLTTPLNVALFSGGLLLAPMLAAILAMTTRHLAAKSSPQGSPGKH